MVFLETKFYLDFSIARLMLEKEKGSARKGGG
jgi:hypothetical protein